MGGEKDEKKAPVYELTQHAKDVMREREIPLEWVEKAFSGPELVEVSGANPLQERRFCRILEFGGRVLRVVVNTEFVPPRVVSVFFDRRMKGKL